MVASVMEWLRSSLLSVTHWLNFSLLGRITQSTSEHFGASSKRKFSEQFKEADVGEEVGVFDISISNIDCRYIDTF